MTMVTPHGVVPISDSEIPEPPQELVLALAREIALAKRVLKGEYARTGRWPMLETAIESFYQPPLAGLATPAPALDQDSNSSHHKHNRASRRTGFNYRGSEYWTAAGLLIDEQAARPVAVELRFGCQLVLSLILAWMHFPLFTTGARQGEWMTLGCDRICRELHVTSKSALSCTAELQRCGLVLPGRLETGLISRLEFDTLKADLAGMDVAVAANDYWQARCVQQKSTFYRLKPGIARPFLPEFNPFSPQVEAKGVEKDLKRTWNGPEKDMQSAFELEVGQERTCTTSFSGPHDHDSDSYEYDMREKGSKKEGGNVENLKEKGITPAQEERFLFLKHSHTQFNGWLGGEMSDQAAAKLSAQYEMPVLTAALKKVSRDWARNAHLIENPIALFITEIPKQAARPAAPSSNGGVRGGRQSKRGPIDFDKYTTGIYKHLTQS